MRVAGAFQHSDSIVIAMRADDGTFTDVNPAFERITGYRRAEVLGRSTVELQIWPDPQTRASIWSRLRSERCLAAQPVTFQDRFGHAYDGLLSCELFESGDGPEVLAILQDLRSTSSPRPPPNEDVASYRALFEAAAEGLYRSLPGGGFLDVNPALATMFGYDSPEHLLTELIGHAARLYVDPEHARHVHRTLHDTGRFDAWRAEVRRRDGSTFWITENSRAVRDPAGRVLFFEGSVVDIDVLVHHERALGEAERKYRELFEHAVAAMFRTHADGRLLDCNLALARMFGYDTVVEALGSVRHMEDLYVDPAERRALLGKLQRDGRLEHEPCVIRHRDGHLLRTLISARAVRDEHGTLNTIEGSLEDVTQRHEAELALARSEARYRALVEHSQVGVYILQDDRYTFVNHAFATMVGWDECALIGQTYHLVVAPECVPALDERLRLRRSGIAVPPDYETVLVRRDGTRIEVSVSTSALELDGVAHVSGTVRDLSQRRRAEAELEYHATHDRLTSLPNRLACEGRLHETMLAARERGDYGYAVLFLDLDGFKVVNDSLGHAAGDRLLLAIAARLDRMLGEQALVARYGGDEFTVLPHGECDAERAIALAQVVLRAFEEPYQVESQSVFSACSIGIVLGRPEYLTTDQVLRDADTAMYRAKAAGKSRHVVFDAAMHAAARERFTLENDLRRGLERREFRVHFQPIVSLPERALVGCEALVRWQHPVRGLLAPAEFLDVAEETGMLAALDDWVLAETCVLVADWRRRFPAHAGLRVSVNVDERQLSDPGFVARLAQRLSDVGLDGSALAMEVTERVFRSGRRELEAVLRGLRQLGVRPVVDDFGTGYSSLESFAASPFDAVKIDRSFVSDVESNPRHLAIVRTIAGLARELGLGLTAEGVETEGQAVLMTELGCTTAQGYLFARPMPPEALEHLLQAPLA